MTTRYTPELGQMVFGQPHQRHEMPEDWETCLAAIGALIDRAHGENPTSNSGARFESDVFSMHSYSWSDDEQPWNFKCGEIEASWYKYLGRGGSINDAGLTASLAQTLVKCVESIPSGRLL